METLTRNKITLDGWVLEKLENQDDILSFDCGDSDLNEYFRVDSVNYRKELMTQSYCFYRLGYSQKEAVALVDFCNDCLTRNFITPKSRREINHQKRGYKSFPALKITRLGVDQAFQHSGVGRALLTVIKHFFISDNQTDVVSSRLMHTEVSKIFMWQMVLLRHLSPKKISTKIVQPSPCTTT